MTKKLSLWRRNNKCISTEGARAEMLLLLEFIISAKLTPSSHILRTKVALQISSEFGETFVSLANLAVPLV